MKLSQYISYATLLSFCQHSLLIKKYQENPKVTPKLVSLALIGRNNAVLIVTYKRLQY
jgi:hypothetical protein